MSWTEQRLNPEEQKLVKVMMDNASKNYAEWAATMRTAQDVPRAAGEAASGLFYDMLKIANAQGKRVPTNVSRGTLANMTADFMQIANDAGLVQPQNRQEAGAMMGTAIRHMRDSYAWREANERAGRAKRQAEMQRMGGVGGMAAQGMDRQRQAQDGMAAQMRQQTQGVQSPGASAPQVGGMANSLMDQLKARSRVR